MANPNLGEMVASTLAYQGEEVADAASNNNALFNKIRANGRVKKHSGGKNLQEPTLFAVPTVQWFTDYERLGTDPKQVIDCYEAEWKQVAVPVTMSGMEIRKNGESRERLIDLMAEKIDAAKIALYNEMNTSFASDGTRNASKELTGLAKHVAIDPSSGTYQGVDRATYSWAQNQTYDFSSDLTESRSPATIKRALVRAAVECVRGADKIDLWLLENDLWTDLHDAESAMERIIVEKGSLGKAGFTTLSFMGAEVVLTGGYGGLTNNYGYGLNSKTFRLHVHKDLYFTRLGSKREPVDQDCVIEFLGFMGQLMCNNPLLNTVVKD